MRPQPQIGSLAERKQFGSQVTNRVLAIRLVQWLGWVFETQERKKEQPTNQNKERKKDNQTKPGPTRGWF